MELEARRLSVEDVKVKRTRNRKSPGVQKVLDYIAAGGSEDLATIMNDTGVSRATVYNALREKNGATDDSTVQETETDTEHGETVIPETSPRKDTLHEPAGSGDGKKKAVIVEQIPRTEVAEEKPAVGSSGRSEADTASSEKVAPGGDRVNVRRATDDIDGFCPVCGRSMYLTGTGIVNDVESGKGYKSIKSASCKKCRIYVTVTV